MMIERIEIVTPIQGRTGTVMAQRVEIDSAGRMRFIDPIDLQLGFDGTDLPKEVQDALTAIDAQQQATIVALTTERDSLQSQLTAMTTERETALSEKASLQTQFDIANATLETLRSRIYELENPPNPFPNSDWHGFRSAALSSPTIMRMAMSNIGNFMMLLIYLTEMQKDPATSLKMAAVWNEMENKTPLAPEEIEGINALAEKYKVPMVLDSEGQIQL